MIVGMSAISVLCLTISQVQLRAARALAAAGPAVPRLHAGLLAGLAGHHGGDSQLRPGGAREPRADVAAGDLPVGRRHAADLQRGARRPAEHLGARRASWRTHYRGPVTVHVLDDGASWAAELLAAEFGFELQGPPGPRLVQEGRQPAPRLPDLLARLHRDLRRRLLPAGGLPRPPAAVPRRRPEPRHRAVAAVLPARMPSRRSMERGAAAVQELFYRMVQVSRDQRDGAICVGSCAVYRRAALDDIGGTTLIEHSEDVHTGFDLRRAGWGLRYIPVPLATGVCPEDADSFLTQQYRWCSGSMSLLASRKFWTTRLPLIDAAVLPVGLLLLHPHRGVRVRDAGDPAGADLRGAHPRPARQLRVDRAEHGVRAGRLPAVEPDPLRAVRADGPLPLQLGAPVRDHRCAARPSAGLAGHRRRRCEGRHRPRVAGDDRARLCNLVDRWIGGAAVRAHQYGRKTGSSWSSPDACTCSCCRCHCRLGSGGHDERDRARAQGGDASFAAWPARCALAAAVVLAAAPRRVPVRPVTRARTSSRSPSRPTRSVPARHARVAGPRPVEEEDLRCLDERCAGLDGPGAGARQAGPQDTERGGVLPGLGGSSSTPCAPTSACAARDPAGADLGVVELARQGTERRDRRSRSRRTRPGVIAHGKYDAYIRRRAGDEVGPLHAAAPVRPGAERRLVPVGHRHRRDAQHVGAVRRDVAARVADLPSSQHVHNVVWAWSPNLLSRPRHYPLRALYPGNRYVDIVGHRRLPVRIRRTRCTASSVR